LSTIGEKLRIARENREIDLEDVSAITKINTRFLQALEEDNFDILSEPYVKVFLKAFAYAVGLNGDEIVIEYESAKRSKTEEESIEPFSPPSPAPKRKLELHLNLKPYVQSYWHWAQENIRTILYGLFGLTVMAVFIILILSRPHIEATRERPSEGVKAEKSALTLSISSAKRLYLMIAMDGGDTNDFYLSPNTMRDFSAEKDFWLLTSDIGATSLILNGVRVADLGQAGWIAQVKIDSSTAHILKTYPPLRQRK
jgi:hypothetical protein